MPEYGEGAKRVITECDAAFGAPIALSPK